jgi:hypothetical protein
VARAGVDDAGVGMEEKKKSLGRWIIENFLKIVLAWFALAKGVEGAGYVLLAYLVFQCVVLGLLVVMGFLTLFAGFYGSLAKLPSACASPEVEMSLSGAFAGVLVFCGWFVAGGLVLFVMLARVIFQAVRETAVAKLEELGE